MVSSISMIVFPYTLRRAVNVLNDCALAKEAVRFDELFVVVKVAGRLGERLRAGGCPKTRRGLSFRTGLLYPVGRCFDFAVGPMG
jgi:hypothetical protein